MSEKPHALPSGLRSWGFNSVGSKRQDYVSGISHGGAVPKVQGSGRREREKPSLQ